MKMKINKACDLNSISVLPPHARRSSGVGTSGLGKSQTTQTQQQLRSQQSQQSFSQGISSSQHGLFSQFSQNTQDETLTNHEPRLSSQDREPSVKRLACLPPIMHPREESQMQLSRSSTNMMRKWSVPEHKCQISEELEHRIGMVETSLSRTGMILDSIQSDVMQVNKGTKETVMEMESIRQKLIFHDDSLQIMNKGQEDIKSILVEGFKSLTDQIKQNAHKENIQEITSMILALPRKFESCALQIQNDLYKTFIKEIQAIACILKVPNNKIEPPIPPPPSHPPVGIIYRSASRDVKNVSVHPKVQQAPLVPKNEMSGWKSVKREVPSRDMRFSKKLNGKGISPIQQKVENRVIIDSDEEDTDEGFSCLFNVKEKDKTSVSRIALAENVKDETERILRKARRRKRKCSNHIIIN